MMDRAQTLTVSGSKLIMITYKVKVITKRFRQQAVSSTRATEGQENTYDKPIMNNGTSNLKHKGIKG